MTGEGEGRYKASYPCLPNISPIFLTFSDWDGSIKEWVHGWRYIGVVEVRNSIPGIFYYPPSDVGVLLAN